MEIIILGSGTATPSVKRSSSSIFIRVGNIYMLVDIGPGAIRRLCEAGIDYKSIDLIAITHFHPDHVSDLSPFLFASNYAHGPKREAPFYVIGPVGLINYYDGLKGLYDHWIVPDGNRLNLRELSDKEMAEWSLEQLKIRTAPAEHSRPALSYRLEACGKSVTISGDTDYSENLVELASDSDILITECSFPDSMKVKGHLTPSEAGKIAANSRSKRLILTHMYPPCEEAPVEAQASKTFHGEIIKAHDLMRLKV